MYVLLVQLTLMSDDEADGGSEQDDHHAPVVNALHAAVAPRPNIPPPPPVTAEERVETPPHAPTPHYPPAAPAPPPTKDNYPPPKGLNNIVKNTSDLPAEVQKRIFLQDECVLGEFDTLRTENTSVSPRLHIYLSIFTLGLYDLVLLLMAAYKFIKHVICCCECARDEVFYSRDKLTITNKGRVLHWTLSVLQKNKIDQQTHHTILSSLRVHKVSV